MHELINILCGLSFLSAIVVMAGSRLFWIQLRKTFSTRPNHVSKSSSYEFISIWDPRFITYLWNRGYDALDDPKLITFGRFLRNAFLFMVIIFLLAITSLIMFEWLSTR